MHPHNAHAMRRRHARSHSGAAACHETKSTAGLNRKLPHAEARHAAKTAAKAAPKAKIPRPQLVFKNMPAQSVLSSTFQYLVDIPVMQSALVITGGLWAIVLTFWAAYWALAASDFSRRDEPIAAGAENMADVSSVDATCLLWYSVATTTTLGDAPCTPDGGRALTLANIHAMVVQLALVYVTGVVFTRMSKPGLHIAISKILLIDFDDENIGRCLKTRIFFDTPGAQLIDVKFSLSYTRRLTPTFMKTSLLSLTRSEASLLRIGTEITHPITSSDNESGAYQVGEEDSPLVGETIESLEEKGARFTLTVIGTEESTMQTCFFSRSFNFQNGGILDGHLHKLKDMAEATSSGGRAINFGNLHEVVRNGEAPEPLSF